MEKKLFNDRTYLKIISDEKDFCALRYVWNDLLKKSNAVNIFLTWEWLYIWWKAFNENRKMCILAIYQDDNLVGLAPFLLRKVRYFRLILYQRIEFLASGEKEKDEICSDYLDFIIMKGKEKEVLELIVEYLINSFPYKWEEIILANILESSSNLKYLEEIIKEKNFKFEKNKREICSFINLPKSWQEYLAQLSRKSRYNIQKSRRELAKLNHRFYNIEKEEDLEKGIETLISLHQHRWAAKEKKGVFSSQKFTEFHRTIMPILFKNGWLNLSFLMLENEPIACLYNLKYKNKIYCYQSGLKTQEDNNIRPGLLINSYCIEKAISEGLNEYDFLKGDSSYKTHLADETRYITEVKITKRTLKEVSFTFIQKMVETLRYLKQFFRKTNESALDNLSLKGQKYVSKN